MKERLFAAGLGLLAGVASSELTLREGPGVRLAHAERDRVAASAEWRALEAAWKEAEAVASGSRGQYPFSEAGQKRLLEQLASAGRGLDALVKAGLLSAPAAELLKKDLALLDGKVRAFRPTNMKGATCYEPMPLRVPQRESLERLRARVPLVLRLEAGGTLPRAVLEKLITGLERDLAEVAKPSLGVGRALTKVEEKDAAAIRARLERKLAALRAKTR
ncbi:MAG: hypothetical protein ACOY3Y_17670 [Acidobacteriota bacterium]